MDELETLRARCAELEARSAELENLWKDCTEKDAHIECEERELEHALAFQAVLERRLELQSESIASLKQYVDRDVALKEQLDDIGRRIACLENRPKFNLFSGSTSADQAEHRLGDKSA